MRLLVGPLQLRGRAISTRPRSTATPARATVKRALVLAAFGLAAAGAAAGQPLRGEPLVFGDGRLTVAGDLSATFSCAHADTLPGCSEDLGYFNYSDYETSLLRNFRMNVAAALRTGRRVSFLSEFRSDNLHHPVPYALYMRVRPWVNRRFDIQAGRIPPTFGAFSRRPYPNDNVLIGTPLAYQYLVSLRPDALPANADELLGMRGRGWLSSFSLGNAVPEAGVPLVHGLRWDTGVQARGVNDHVDVALAVTTGTLAQPLVRDNNAGKQLSGRIAVTPLTGLVAGASAAHGTFAARRAIRAAGLPEDDRSVTQTAWGADLEYSRGYYLLRAEAIVSAFRLPAVGAPRIDAPLRAYSTAVEGRYRVRPGFYAAARFERLLFNEITGSAGRRTWEAPVWRAETGIGYSLQRNLLLKLAYQYNDRDGGRVPRVSIGAAQLVFWF
jgi:hypothetical protein